MSQEEGASTDVTGTVVDSRAEMTAGKGSRTSPEKLNPSSMLRRESDYNEAEEYRR